MNTLRPAENLGQFLEHSSEVSPGCKIAIKPLKGRIRSSRLKKIGMAYKHRVISGHFRKKIKMCLRASRRLILHCMRHSKKVNIFLYF